MGFPLPPPQVSEQESSLDLFNCGNYLGSLQGLVLLPGLSLPLSSALSPL